MDGLDEQQLREVEPEGGDYILVSRLRDGTSVRVAERKILPLIQNRITQLEREDVQCILMLCTGKFPEVFHNSVPLICPYDILSGVVPVFAKSGHIGVVVPDLSQCGQAYERWKQIFPEVTVTVASPYHQGKEIEEAGEILQKHKVDLIVPDCIGYTREMKDKLMRITRKPVMLPRTLMVRVIMEFIAGS